MKGDEILIKDTEYMRGIEALAYFAYPSVTVPRFIIPVKDRVAQKFVIRILSADKGLLGKFIRALICLPGGIVFLGSVIFRQRVMTKDTPLNSERVSIEELRTLVKERWGELESGATCNPQHLSFTKFCQRIVGQHTKVLFLVTYHGEVKCMIKIMRSPSFNEMLVREKEAQESVSQKGICRAPKVYFDGYVRGYYVYGEEVIAGLPISKKVALKHERKIIEFTNSFPLHKKTIPSEKLAATFSLYAPKEDERLSTLITHLAGLKVVLSVGLTHGDLGTPNILAYKNSLYFIDWGRSGERPVAHSDAVYFLSRLYRVKGLEDWRLRVQSKFQKYTSLGLTEIEAIYSFVSVLEIMRKRYPSEYGDVLREFLLI